MPIEAVSQEAFNKLDLPEECRSHWSREHETGWYADSRGDLLGVILFDPGRNTWGYMMCARPRAGGEFKRLGVGADFQTLRMAQADLIRSMERHRIADA